MRILLFCIGLFISPIICYSQKMPECWYRTIAAIENGQLDKANLWSDTCLSINKKNADFLLVKGEVYYLQKKYLDAIDIFGAVERINKGAASLYLAKCYSQHSDTNNTFKWLEQHLGSSFRIKESDIKLDQAFERISETTQWNNLWKKEWYSSYERLIAEVEYLNSIDQFEEALDLLNQKIKKGSRYHLYALRSKVLLKLGSPNLALDDINRALKKAKRNPEFYIHRARIYLMQNKLNSAQKDVEKAIAITGNNPKYLNELANIQILEKTYLGAYNNLVYYLDFYPSDVYALTQKVECAIELNYMVDALFDINRLIKSDSGKKEYRYLRGICYIKTQNYQYASDDFSFAIKGSYKLSDSYYYRGLCSLYISKKEEACTDWDKALKYGKFEAQELLYKHCNKSAVPKK